MRVRRSLLVLLAIVACKSNEDKAKAIIADTTKPPTEALTDAAKLVYKDDKTVRHTFGADCDATCRVFVIADRPDQGTAVTRGTDTTITFSEVLDGKRVEDDTMMMRLGQPLKLTEVLVANRYKTKVEGKSVTIVEPWRTVVKGDGFQSFDAWTLDDLSRLEPYDLVMTGAKPLVLREGRPVSP